MSNTNEKRILTKRIDDIAALLLTPLTMIERAELENEAWQLEITLVNSDKAIEESERLAQVSKPI